MVYHQPDVLRWKKSRKSRARAPWTSTPQKRKIGIIPHPKTTTSNQPPRSNPTTSVGGAAAKPQDRACGLAGSRSEPCRQRRGERHLLVLRWESPKARGAGNATWIIWGVCERQSLEFAWAIWIWFKFGALEPLRDVWVWEELWVFGYWDLAEASEEFGSLRFLESRISVKYGRVEKFEAIVYRVLWVRSISK